MLVAQAVLARPQVLVLDEGLQHLDATRRRNLRAKLREELPDTTVFEVSHLGAVTFPEATRILVLAEGRVVDTGQHDELMARCTVYRDLVQSIEE